jgi:OOP family OmpA-OmpF porin
MNAIIHTTMKKTSMIIVICLLAIQGQAQEISSRYELVRMSTTKVNTTFDDVSPIISNDGKQIYYFIFNHPENTYARDNSQDIWVTTQDDKGDWSPTKHLGPPFNQNRYNQVFNILPDGNLFIRGGRSKNSVGFSLVSPNGASWTELKIPEFEKMNKGVFYGGNLSADGNHVILYFSEVAGSRYSDFYISSKQGGDWTKPSKLKLSSAYDDYAPFIGPDQKTLYFASDRPSKDKVGNTDIFKATRLDDTWTQWSEPVNLGNKINTGSADAYFSIDAHGNIFTARMNSRAEGGNFDLFLLKPKNITITLKGNVFDQKTQQPMMTDVILALKDKTPMGFVSNKQGQFETKLPEVKEYHILSKAVGYLPFDKNFTMPKVNSDTTVVVNIPMTPIAKKLVLNGSVRDKKTNEVIPFAKASVVMTSNGNNLAARVTNGNYQSEIPSLGWYRISATAEGYLNGADSVDVNNPEVTPVVKDVFLAPIEVGLTIVLKNIYFDFDRTTLKPESFTELNKVVEFLQQNPRLEVEIAGHTDSKGSDTYNSNLSQGRSQSVVDYIISQGIDASRLTAHGYGEAKPIDTNDTEEGRANNRRVEFTVLKN